MYVHCQFVDIKHTMARVASESPYSRK